MLEIDPLDKNIERAMALSRVITSASQLIKTMSEDNLMLAVISQIVLNAERNGADGNLTSRDLVLIFEKLKPYFVGIHTLHNILSGSAYVQWNESKNTFDLLISKGGAL